ncbi:DUF1810 domain-containing protein [Sandarakinorhabdus sp. DWP1-3-1]|uniref:DUF1810 domain-containing protein n=1 Tax=Sandarakinorhabdus sp. DWP1-3-1 TaxID=2804627 RepID=UPI003CE7949C
MTLQRFVDAQAPVYVRVLRELTFGDKVTHWMWFIFPQLRGLGYSEKARFYGLESLDEATAYLAHPLLGPRLIRCCEAMRPHADVGAAFVLGDVDAAKFRSCLTLFARVPGAPPVFADLLDLFYAGEADASTVRLLAP